MGAEIIPFDFEEQAVRVVMRDDEPWFVAADVCRVLELGNPSETLRRLDDDEVTLSTIEGNHRPTNLINESGLYALIFTSRKDEAKRFRKWITSEVLPSIRRTGRYEAPGVAANDQPEGDFAGMSFREAELWLQSVREARLTRGTRAAIRLWDRSPLPRLDGRADPADPAEGRAALAHLLDRLDPRAMTAEDQAAQGLRGRADGLFVANYPLPVFEGSRWAGGAHGAALAALPGADRWATTLGAVRTRGIVIPWHLIGAPQENGEDA